jgi:hypothetical protein
VRLSRDALSECAFQTPLATPSNTYADSSEPPGAPAELLPAGEQGVGLLTFAPRRRDFDTSSAAQAASGPAYNPISNELGKLLYYCSAKRDKTVKVVRALLKKVSKDVPAATRSPKNKASLCISLTILDKILQECRGNIAPFASEALEILNAALSVEPRDLDIVERAAAVVSPRGCLLDLMTWISSPASQPSWTLLLSLSTSRWLLDTWPLCARCAASRCSRMTRIQPPNASEALRWWLFKR